MRDRRVRSLAVWRASSKVDGLRPGAFSRCRRCRRRNARSRWRATAARPIRFAIPSSGCARTIPPSFSRASIFSMGTRPLPISATWCCASKASPNWPPPRSKTSSSGTGRRARRAIRISRSPDLSLRRSSMPRKRLFIRQAADELLAGYNEVHAKVFDYLAGKLPRPEAMSRQAYQRNVKARAFDVARYLLCFGIPTGVGQVTSIRTLERQVRRLKASEYQELRDLADEIAEACAAEPCLRWDETGSSEAVAPTLARHLDADEHSAAQPRRSARVGGAEPDCRIQCGVHGSCRSDQTHRHADRYRRHVALSGDAIGPIASSTRWRLPGALRGGTK